MEERNRIQEEKNERARRKRKQRKKEKARKQKGSAKKYSERRKAEKEEFDKLNEEEQDKITKENNMKKIEFPYIDELPDDIINTLKITNKVYVDPGKKNLLMIKETNLFIETKKE